MTINLQGRLHPTYNTFNYISCYTFCITKGALISLKSTGQCSCGAWHLTSANSHRCGRFCILSLRRMLKYSFFFFFVKDKFAGDLQPSAVPDFAFTSTKFIHYFSYVIRNAHFPANFTKTKFLLAASTTTETFQHFFFVDVPSLLCVSTIRWGEFSQKHNYKYMAK